MLGLIIGLIVGIVIGVLVGRANPKKADKLAELANKAKTEIQKKAGE